MAETLVVVPCGQLSYIPYIFRHCDLLVLKIIISNEYHERKLKIKKDSFTNCYSEGLDMEHKYFNVTIFSWLKKECNAFCYWNNLSFV